MLSAASVNIRSSASERSASSKNSIRPRPRAFAWYMAASALRSRLSGVASLSATAMPMPALEITCWPSTEYGALSAATIRSAICWTSSTVTSAQTTTNSSPPILATVSVSRICPVIRVAADLRTSSPMARPNRSLITLKSSTSRHITARCDRGGGGPRPALDHPVGEQRAVRQVGEQIVQGLVGELLLHLLAHADVLQLGQIVGPSSGPVSDQGDEQRRPDQAAVGPQESTFPGEVVAHETAAVGHHRRQRGLAGLAQVAPVPADQFLLRASEQRAHRGVDPQRHAGQVEDDGTNAHLLECRVETGVGFPAAAVGEHEGTLPRAFGATIRCRHQRIIAGYCDRLLLRCAVLLLLREDAPQLCDAAPHARLHRGHRNPE